MAGVRVGVLGASGQIGSQLLAMLSGHPHVSEIVPFSVTQQQPVSAILPSLKHLGLSSFQNPQSFDYSTLDCVFSCLPHGESFKYFSNIRHTSALFIDLSSDYRVASAREYAEIHRQQHPLPEVLCDFVRVVPEINGSDSRNHKWISVPGCNATAVILAMYPLLKERVLTDDDVITDIKVSSSGSSAKRMDVAQLHYNRAGGVRVHRLLGVHRHTREIAAYLRERVGARQDIVINTYSVDMVRGILASCYCRCLPGFDNRRARAIYRESYGACDSIRIIKQSVGHQMFPNPKYVVGTNFCDIGFEFDPLTGRGVAIAAIDNLIKGGAGNAMQVFNLHYGLNPALSIPRLPVYI